MPPPIRTAISGAAFELTASVGWHNDVTGGAVAGAVVTFIASESGTSLRFANGTNAIPLASLAEFAALRVNPPTPRLPIDVNSFTGQAKLCRFR